ncbi:MAG: hydrogenase [Thermoplasmatota archaeon]
MVPIDTMFRIETGQGFWTPIVWVISIIVAFLIIIIIRNFGNKSYKKDTEQVKSFLSGNPEYSKEYMHIKSSNLYWGFTKSMEGLFDLFKKMHTGNASDYVLWFVIILAIFLLIEVI